MTRALKIGLAAAAVVAAVARIRSTQTRDLAGPRNGLIGARFDF